MLIKTTNLFIYKHAIASNERAIEILQKYKCIFYQAKEISPAKVSSHSMHLYFITKKIKISLRAISNAHLQASKETSSDNVSSQAIKNLD